MHQFEKWENFELFLFVLAKKKIIKLYLMSAYKYLLDIIAIVKYELLKLKYFKVQFARSTFT